MLLGSLSVPVYKTNTAVSQDLQVPCDESGVVKKNALSAHIGRTVGICFRLFSFLRTKSSIAPGHAVFYHKQVWEGRM